MASGRISHGTRQTMANMEKCVYKRPEGDGELTWEDEMGAAE